MGKVCYLCRRMSEKASTRSYHRFPMDHSERMKWFENINMVPVLTRNIFLCSDHFDPSSFVTQPLGRRMLKHNARPQMLPSTSKDIELESLDTSSSVVTSSVSEQTVKDVQVVTHQKEPSPLAVPLSSSSATKSASESVAEEHSSEQMGPPKERLLDQQLRQKRKRPVPTGSTISSTQGSTTESEGHTVKEQRFEGRTKRKSTRYVGDCLTDEMETPRRAKRNWHIAKTKIQMQSKKIRALQQQKRRLQARVYNLKSLLKHLEANNFISENTTLTVNASIPDSSSEIIKRFLKGPSRQKYTPELRAFALTLNFYSPKAYNYVRNKFNNSLPHPRTIAKWYKSVNGAPGFTEEALNALKIKTTEVAQKGQKILCNMVFDEVAIRKQIEWTGTKFTGYVDLGTNIVSDSLPAAKEALVFMLVALTSHWKLPIGYFFINSLTSSEKANLVNSCLEHLMESEVIITSLTFDGTPTNLNMATLLGANFEDPNNIISFFMHPQLQQKIYFYLDACHMLKLIRNCLASQGQLTDQDGGQVLWRFFEQLVELQETEGLHAATKLRKRHIDWTKEKMKVKVAAQTFSNSVADALLFLGHDLQHESFRNVDATANFCKIINNLFDIFNVRNFAAKYKYRRPLSSENCGEIFEYLRYCKRYILGLRLNNVPVLSTNRKTGFLGFLINIESLMNMYFSYVASDMPLLKYILSYKMSQDHLEIFFSAIRSRGGSNNNPTPRQFEHMYKRLLLHTEVKGADSGNAVALDSTSILAVSSNTLTRNDDNQNLEESEEYIRVSKEIEDHDYLGAPVWHLTTYVTDVVAYISGFVVRCLKQCVTCAFCNAILETDVPLSRLQIRKQWGKLATASPFVITVCKAGEQCLRCLLAERDKLFHIKHVDKLLINSTLRNLSSDTFSIFDSHILNDDPLNSHSIALVKLILQKYFKIRLHYETRRIQERMSEGRIRSLLTKEILFKNQ